MDDYALSNAVIKCLTNLGGKVAILDDMMCPKDTYFIGIDMGHRYDHKNAAESYTQLVMSLIDTAGTIITSKSVSSLPLNEALSPFATINILNRIKNTISKINRKMPKKLIFHRDGKVHVDDVQIILQSVKQVFGIEDIEIIEIIKSGHPYVTEYLNSTWHNRPSGSAWIVPSKNYAILITNDQPNSVGELNNPIIIQRQHGNMPFENIVEQVYWLSKIYINNLYFASRLPVTTEVANNHAGTGMTEWRPSFISGLERNNNYKNIRRN